MRGTIHTAPQHLRSIEMINQALFDSLQMIWKGLCVCCNNHGISLRTGCIRLTDSQNVSIREVVAGMAFAGAADKGYHVVVAVRVLIAWISKASIDIYD
jgi:hypothetical protein